MYVCMYVEIIAPSFARTVAYCGYVLPPEFIDPSDADRMANVVYIEHQLAQAKEQQARDEVRLMRLIDRPLPVLILISWPRGSGGCRPMMTSSVE